MRLVLFDDVTRTSLYPFTHTRPVADIRCGIYTMRERWELFLNLQDSGSLTEPYLREVFPTGNDSDWLIVSGGVFATAELAAAVHDLAPGESLVYEERVIAAHATGELPTSENWPALSAGMPAKGFTQEIKFLRKPWDIFSVNDWALRQDYKTITAGRYSAATPEDVHPKGTEIFIEEGAVLQAGTIINASTGPVYVGKDAEIMEGCIIRGPFALCEGATLKMGAKIYGGTTIGPACKVGGEVSNVVFFGNSNKGHDGFLGNSVIGEWCNLGADTNSSNLKNNYDEVKVWDEAANKSVKTGLTFCGLLMGDHSKCGINTMFNTGTIAGVSCNIWGGGFPEKFIPSFAWGGQDGMTTYQVERALETAGRMMARRGKTLQEAERMMLRHVFAATANSRALMISDK